MYTVKVIFLISDDAGSSSNIWKANSKGSRVGMLCSFRSASAVENLRNYSPADYFIHYTNTLVHVLHLSDIFLHTRWYFNMFCNKSDYQTVSPSPPFFPIKVCGNQMLMLRKQLQYIQNVCSNTNVTTSSWSAASTQHTRSLGRYSNQFVQT